MVIMENQETMIVQTTLIVLTMHVTKVQQTYYSIKIQIWSEYAFLFNF